MTTSAVIDGLDDARRALYRLTLRRPALRGWLLNRHRRLLLLSSVSALVAFLLALRFPLVSLWFGAAVLGVPHIVGGVRHTVVARRVSLGALLCAGAIFSVSVFHVATATHFSAATWSAVSVAMCGAVAAELIAARRRLLFVIPIAATAVAMSRFPFTALVLLTHVHALCSVAFFLLAARKAGHRLWPFALLVAGCIIAAAAGLLDSWMPDFPFIPASARDSLLSEIYGLAPNLDGDRLKRLVFIYAFGQSLHYAVWIRLMPEVDRVTPVPKPLRAQLALLRRDFGRAFLPMVVLCIAAAILLLLGGGAARETYFALGFFHFALEGAALARLASRGRQ